MTKQRIVDEIGGEHIRLPGCPDIIVTRVWAYQWLIRMGYRPIGGFGSADYMAFAGPAESTPLTDLSDPAVRQFLSYVESEVSA